jgi:hypothetical protein
MSTKNRELAVDPQELARLLVERDNAGDIEGMIVLLYEPDAVLAICGGEMADGAAQIREFYTAFLATGVRSMSGSNAQHC